MDRKPPRSLDPVQKQFAREMRSNMPKAEAILWSRLRGKQLKGYRFRRQHPLGPYIADFACISSKLVIELDGQSHEGRQAYDAAREDEIRSLGWRTVRYLNTDVLERLDDVLEDILRHCEGASGSSPVNGGG